MADLNDLRDAIEHDPAAVAELLTPTIDRLRSEAEPSPGELLHALVLRGRARQALFEVDLAERDLREAIELALQAHDRETEADARLALASVLTFSGRLDEVHEHIDLVESTGTATQRAHAGLQRAAIALRTGDLRGALAAYAEALPPLDAAGAQLDVARVLANRGVILGMQGDAEGALTDLRGAWERFDHLGHAFAAAQMTHNVGWALARTGNIPDALAAFDDAEQQFGALGHTAEESLWDRAEVLLAAGLATDARELCERAVPPMLAAGNVSGAAEAMLTAAQAARLLGDAATAAEHAQRSAGLFDQLGNEHWAGIARLEQLRADTAQHPPDVASIAAAGRLADTLEGDGHAAAALSARALAVILAADAGELAAARHHAERLPATGDRHGLVEERVLAALAEATLARAEGDTVRARRAVRAGLDTLARHQDLLGAIDARVQVTTHARALAAVGLDLALATRRPAAVLEAVERRRATALLHPPARPPASTELAAALNELRAVTAAVREAEKEGSDPSELRGRRQALERQVARRSLHARNEPIAAASSASSPNGPNGRARQPGRRGGTGRAAIDPAALRSALGPGTLASLFTHDGRLGVVVVTEHRSRLLDLGPAEPLQQAAAALRSNVAALARPGGSAAVRRARHDLAGQALSTIDTLVFAALPPDGPLVLVVPSEWNAVPWRAASGARGRRVVIAPSAAWWLAAQDANPTRSGPTRVLAAAGPRLEHAAEEARAVAACYPDASALVGGAATAAAVTAGLPTASVVHLAAHGHLRTDQPLWSAIELADGPLTVYDLVPHSPLPPTMVLSACDAGISAARGGGDELLGFTATLLAAGARSIVAAVAPLPDTALTRTVMVGLHRGLAAGLPAGHALDDALDSIAEAIPGDPRDPGKPSGRGGLEDVESLRMVLSVFGHS